MTAQTSFEMGHFSIVALKEAVFSWLQDFFFFFLMLHLKYDLKQILTSEAAGWRCVSAPGRPEPRGTPESAGFLSATGPAERDSVGSGSTEPPRSTRSGCEGTHRQPPEKAEKVTWWKKSEMIEGGHSGGSFSLTPAHLEDGLCQELPIRVQHFSQRGVVFTPRQQLCLPAKIMKIVLRGLRMKSKRNLKSDLLNLSASTYKEQTCSFYCGCLGKL